MSFGEAIGRVFQNYANFNGRARRSEYWYFVLFNAIIGGVFGVLGYVFDSSVVLTMIQGLYSLVILIPEIAVSTRRLHDIGKSGWWQLLELTIIGIIPLIIWYCRDSQPGENLYGPNPKGF